MEGNGFDVTIGDLVLVRALYYEVNASVFAACRKLRFLIRKGMHGRTVECLWLAEG